MGLTTLLHESPFQLRPHMSVMAHRLYPAERPVTPLLVSWWKKGHSSGFRDVGNFYGVPRGERRRGVSYDTSRTPVSRFVRGDLRSESARVHERGL